MDLNSGRFPRKVGIGLPEYVVPNDALHQHVRAVANRFLIAYLGILQVGARLVKVQDREFVGQHQVWLKGVDLHRVVVQRFGQVLTLKISLYPRRLGKRRVVCVRVGLIIDVPGDILGGNRLAILPLEILSQVKAPLGGRHHLPALRELGHDLSGVPVHLHQPPAEVGIEIVQLGRVVSQWADDLRLSRNDHDDLALGPCWRRSSCWRGRGSRRRRRRSRRSSGWRCRRSARSRNQRHSNAPIRSASRFHVKTSHYLGVSPYGKLRTHLGVSPF